MKIFRNITLTLMSLASAVVAKNAAYITENIPFPEGETIEVGCLAEISGKRLAVGTRFGEVWIVEGAYEEDLSKVKWTRFATGMHEPFGIFERDGDLVVTQRPEVTLLRDHDKDGVADEYFTLCDDWGYSPAAYEWAWGSDPDKDGNHWVLLTLSGSVSSNVLYRGWALKITPEGEMIPAAPGVRSPGGLGTNSEGDLFYSDNQGFWNGSSSIKPLVEGKHMGAQSANRWYKTANFGDEPPEPQNDNFEDYRKLYKDIVPAALVVPHHRMSRSPTQIVPDTTGGKFGPFADQLIFGEVTNAEVERGFLEKVNGVWQGSVFRLTNEVGSGPVALRLSEEGFLFVGQTIRGWGGSGKAPQALERIKWNGQEFFDIKHISVTPAGFDLHFTQPVNQAKAMNKQSYHMEAWTYPYGPGYGGPEKDKQTPVITDIKVSEDGKVVHLSVDGRVQGHLHQIAFPNVTSAKEEKPYNDRGWYTLNEIPAK
ncbi:hypothetical protein [Rubritalea marina]|uniref:hypothetical protein n=1 Tax=Rubritalea marina TaxID=361055 RepID=UPI000376A1B5|nr:hypothetical protein [Rubritalea marina]